MKIKVTLVLLLHGLAIQPASAELAPKLVQLDQLLLNEDFSQSRPLEKENWKARQHTRWAIQDGVLRGQPSTKAFQASQDHHQGLEPRLSIPSCPQEFAIAFSMRFLGGEGTPLCPFIEFGHHVGRIYWSETGARLVANKESVQLDSDERFVLEKGTWYHGLAEIKGDEILIRFRARTELLWEAPQPGHPTRWIWDCRIQRWQGRIGQHPGLVHSK